MLRIITCTKSEAVKDYFEEGYQRDDYYSEGAQITGKWFGKGKDHLGLPLEVNKETFHSLVDNQHPITGTPLTVRNKKHRRIGYDMNFHVPKSVSLLYGIMEDERILQAFEESVQETMQDIEADMKTRVRTNGQQLDRHTGNLVGAQFIHTTSRPVNGIPDPHLHAHCVVFNTTYDQEEQRWKAGQFGQIKRDAPYYEARYHSRLAMKVKELGYSVVHTPQGWEIENIPRTLIEKFSRRTQEIERIAREKGIDNDKAKDKLGAQSREGKRHDLSPTELQQLWTSQLSEEEEQLLQHQLHKSYKAKGSAPHILPSQSIEFAIANSFERESVVRERQLLTEAYRHGWGATTIDTIETVYQEHKRLLRKPYEGEVHCSLPEILQEEEEMILLARSGKSAYKPYYPDAESTYEFQSPFLQPTAEGEDLAIDQRRAVLDILSSQDQVMILSGGAGTGKTTLAKEAVQAIERTGQRVHLFAPTAEASRGVLRSEGFANADTIQQLLRNPQKQEEIQGGTLWIDEAGLLDTPSMLKLLRLANAQHARVILSGDTAQHRSVPRGDALRLLRKYAGLQDSKVKQIHRQHGAYRKAIEHLAAGRMDVGFDQLTKLGAIHEVSTEHRYEILAKEYLKIRSQVTSNGAPQTALVVSPTHREGQQVVKLIRKGLHAQSILSRDEYEVPRLINLNYTEAQRGNIRFYEIGHIIQYYQKDVGRQIGDRLEVVDIGHEVKVKDAKGEITPLNLDHSSRFQVFGQDQILIAEGDHIRLTQNGHSQEGTRLNNGATYSIQRIQQDGSVILNNGNTLASDFGHLTYGYVSTSHASQGKTVDHVLIAQSADSFGATSQEQFYVSASRGRMSVQVYTDDTERLKQSIQQSESRLSTIELLEASTHLHIRRNILNPIEHEYPTPQKEITRTA